MFEQSFVASGKTRRPWTVLLAFGGQILLIGALLAIPLMLVETLPVTQLNSVLIAPPPPAPPPPPPPPAAHVSKASHTKAVLHTAPRKFDARRLIAPVRVPKQIANIQDLQVAPPPEIAGVAGGVPGGVAGGVVGGVIGGMLNAAPPPPPPPPAKPAAKPTPSRLRIGGQVEAAKLVHEVQPVYPVLARDARIGGTVRLKAVIASNGTVQDLSLMSGQPLLVPAAMNAVKQWVYKPTYLNGKPVEVLTEVDVDFRLAT